MASSFSNKYCFRRTTSTEVPKFGPKTTALEVVKGLNVKLDGKIVLIRGATSGKSYKSLLINPETVSIVVSIFQDLVLKQLEH
jgi:hypothetical protein